MGAAGDQTSDDDLSRSFAAAPGNTRSWGGELAAGVRLALRCSGARLRASGRQAGREAAAGRCRSPLHRPLIRAASAQRGSGGPDPRSALDTGSRSRGRPLQHQQPKGERVRLRPLGRDDGGDGERAAAAALHGARAGPHHRPLLRPQPLVRPGDEPLRQRGPDWAGGGG